MNTAGILVALAALLNGTIALVDPVTPPNAATGGAVIAALHVSKGEVVRVSVLEGQEPFIEPAAAALAQWQFKDGRSGRALAVVSFREPHLLSMGETEERIPPASAPPAMPYPRVVAQPAYPPNAIDAATVTLRLEVSSSGTVASTEVLRGIGPFVEASVEAAKGWRFSPARMGGGDAIQSEVFAVFVFRAPVLAPSRR
jgi:hypothetical protein